MANDPPTNLRMGFGFEQARAAGAPFQRPPTPNQMNFDLKELAAKNELRKLIKDDPSIRSFVSEVIKANARTCTNQDILFFVKCSRARKSKTGFTVTGLDGKIYNCRRVKKISSDSLVVFHEGDWFVLHRSYIKSIVIN